jgi:hypothetical protein
MPFSGILTQVMPNPTTLAREDALKSLQDRVDKATEFGSNPRYDVISKRTAYFADFNFMTSALMRLCNELKRYPGEQNACDSHLYIKP